MKILITNDDGIFGEGLAVLVNWARKLGDVTVVAPKFQHSGKSHSINIFTPFEIKKTDNFPGILSYSVDSTPADCVRFATLGLETKYDLVLSGVNCGFNLGDDIFYSGTSGAAFEARACGMKSVALSTDAHTFDAARDSLDLIYNYFTKNRLFDVCSLFNVNIPKNNCGIRITRQGGPDYKDIYVHIGNDMFVQEGVSAYEQSGDPTLDTDAVLQYGYISVMPMTLERTDRDALRTLSPLNDRDKT